MLAAHKGPVITPFSGLRRRSRRVGTAAGQGRLTQRLLLLALPVCGTSAVLDVSLRGNTQQSRLRPMRMYAKKVGPCGAASGSLRSRAYADWFLPCYLLGTITLGVPSRFLHSSGRSSAVFGGSCKERLVLVCPPRLKRSTCLFTSTWEGTSRVEGFSSRFEWPQAHLVKLASSPWSF